MNLADVLATFVNAKIRKRGIHYFRGRRVSLSSCDREQAKATVSGTSLYQVALTREGKVLRASCSCPFADRGVSCKHIWAVILAADAKGGLRGADGSFPSRLVAEGGEEPPEASPPKAAAKRPVLKQPHPRSSKAPARVATPPRWHEVLDRLATAAPPPPPPRANSILYMVDAPSTLESQKLTLRILTGRKKRDGSWGKLHPLTLHREEIHHLADSADREILALLAGAAKGGILARYYSHYSDNNFVPAHCEIPDAAADVLLPLASGTGRLHLAFDLESEEILGEPLAWNQEQPWELRVEVQEEPRGDCRVAASLFRNGERLAPGKRALLIGSGLVFADGQGSRLPPGASRWFPLLHPGGDLRVPAADREELLERLLAAPDLPRLDLPESLRVEEVRPVPRPRVRLLPPSPKWPHTWPQADISFLYGGHEVPAGSGNRSLYVKEERKLILRDVEAERKSLELLPDLGFRTVIHLPGEPGWQIPAGRIPKAVRALLDEGWSVEAEGKLYRSASRFRMNVASGVDWFELHGQAEFEGETIALPQLLAALRRGEGFVPLSDGSLGMIPEEWLKKFAPIARLGQSEGDHVRFQSTQAALLDAWLADEPELTCDEAFERARQRLSGFAGVAPAEAPPGFHGELRGYQRAGLGWLHFLRDFGFGGCLADDMGLGKTVQVLALLESRRASRAEEGLPPSLVVVPRSLVFNWLSEAASFAPQLRVLDHTGAGRAREGDPFAGCDLVLTTYGTLRRDIASLRQVEFDYVVLDEGQAIKNADSQTAKAVRLLRGRHRLALSGTPVENHLGELWSLLEFLNPGLLGASPLLQARSEELRDPDAGTRNLLARALRPFILRRTKEQVAPELPAKVEQTLFCELPPKQRRLYDELRDHYRDALGTRIGEQGLGRTKILVLEALLRLRQAACHPGLLDRGRADEPCAKLDLLLPQLREVLAEGHKALVFSQFTSFLALLRDHLDREGISYLYLDGRTRDRREKVEEFQSDPGRQIFLISLKAGGLGLNLTAADYVYLLDPWWNPAVEAQAIDRAHRIGQTRPVFACRIVARDTVEEKILQLQQSKRDLADAVIQADGSLLAGLSREDLELLLS
ncbi:MAG TPA: SNF2-related protein [Thermoanaerobaculia bacterium]|nr:SNF2-related protein [Thermoanaerobaculia bacterium]